MTATATTEYTSLTQWYDSQDEQYQDLYDAIVDRIPFADKWDVNQVIEFVGKLDDLGITNQQQFDDAFYGYNDSWRPEKEFAEEFYEGLGVGISNDAAPGSELWHFIDWQQVWDHSLSYDFSTVEFDGTTFFFNNNF
jgi:hypothetical protein